MIWYICTFLLLWTIASVWWFLRNLGNKCGGPDPWWVWVLGTPTLVIACAIGLIGGTISAIKTCFSKTEKPWMKD